MQKEIDSLLEMLHKIQPQVKIENQGPTDRTEKMWSVGTVGKWDTTKINASKLDSIHTLQCVKLSRTVPMSQGAAGKD